MENGDVFVVVTINQSNLEALKLFDPTRYASLSFANPDAGRSVRRRPGRRRAADLHV